MMCNIDRNKIKNILFDWGGVISEIDFNATINAFKEYGISDFEQLYCKEYQSELFQQLEVGEITPTQFRKELRKKIPNQISDEELDIAWFAMLLDTLQENLDLLSVLKKQYRTFLLSNTNSIHTSMYDEVFDKKHNLKNGLRSLFEKAYYSHEIGMRKPHEAVFEFVLNDSNLDPKETLFIDDSIQNIVTAKNLGIQTFHIDENNSLMDVFTELK